MGYLGTSTGLQDFFFITSSLYDLLSFMCKIQGFNSFLVPTVGYFSIILLMEEIRRAPVEVGSFSHDLQGLIHHRWLFGISEPSTVSQPHLRERRPHQLIWVCEFLKIAHPNSRLFLFSPWDDFFFCPNCFFVHALKVESTGWVFFLLRLCYKSFKPYFAGVRLGSWSIHDR